MQHGHARTTRAPTASPARVAVNAAPAVTQTSPTVAPAVSPAGYFMPLASPLYAKLVVGGADDPVERQADAFADRVMRWPDPTLLGTAPPGDGVLRRACSACADEDKLRREATDMRSGGFDAPAEVHAVLRSPGHSLDSSARSFLEPRVGGDLGGLRVHTDAHAAESAAAVGARAYTVGNNLVFGQGQYQPQTDAGRRLIAHELGHLGAGVVRRSQGASAKVTVEEWEVDATIDGGPMEYVRRRLQLSWAELHSIWGTIRAQNEGRLTQNNLFVANKNTLTIPKRISRKSQNTQATTSDQFSPAAILALQQIQQNMWAELLVSTPDLISSIRALSVLEMQSVLDVLSTEQKAHVLKLMSNSTPRGGSAADHHRTTVQAMAQMGQFKTATNYLKWLQNNDAEAYQSLAPKLADIRMLYPSILTDMAEDVPLATTGKKQVPPASIGDFCDIHGTGVKKPDALDKNNIYYKQIMADMHHPDFVRPEEPNKIAEALYEIQTASNYILNQVDAGADKLIGKAEGAVKQTGDDLAAKVSGLPIVGRWLGYYAKSATFAVDSSVRVVGGAAKGAVGMVTGVAGMVVNPIDTAKGIVEMTKHGGVFVHLAMMMVADEVGATKAADALAESVVNDVTFWKNTAGHMVDRHCKKRSADGKTCEEYDKAELAGRIGFELFMLKGMFKGAKGGAVTKAAGEAVDLAKASEATDAAKAAKATKVVKAIEFPSAAEATDAAKAAKATEVTDAAQAAKPKDVPELPKVAESPSTPKVPEREVPRPKETEGPARATDKWSASEKPEILHPEDAPGDTGSHHVQDGKHIKLCSNCRDLRNLYAEELLERPDLAQKLDALEATYEANESTKGDPARFLETSRLTRELYDLKIRKVAEPVDLGPRPSGWRANIDKKIVKNRKGNAGYDMSDPKNPKLDPGMERRHEISSAEIKDMIGASLNGRSLSERARILGAKHPKYAVKSPLTKAAVDKAARKWYLDEFYREDRLWAGDSSQNRSIGRGYDPNLEKTPEAARKTLKEAVRYRQILKNAERGTATELTKYDVADLL